MEHNIPPGNSYAPGHTDHALIESILELTACADLTTLADALTRILKHRLQTDAISIYQIQASDKANEPGVDALSFARLYAMPSVAGNGESLLDYPVMEESVRQQQPVLRQIDGQRDHYAYPMIGRMGVTHILYAIGERFSEIQIKQAEILWKVWQQLFTLVERNELDALTGLLNRVAFDNRLQEIFSQGQLANRRKEDADARVLALIDIDHFKDVNDAYGHLYGDEVLVQLSHLMSMSFRGSDLVFRFGGEEFVVILRDCTIDKAKRILSRFRERVETHSYPRIGPKTVSIGMTAINSNELPTTILDRADKALYFGKENGRNQCNVYEELVADGKLQPTTPDQDNIELFYPD